MLEENKKQNCLYSLSCELRSCTNTGNLAQLEAVALLLWKKLGVCPSRS